MPLTLYERLAAYEDALQIEWSLTVVRATLVGEALRRLPDDLGRLAAHRPDASAMAGPRYDLNTRVPRAVQQRLRRLHAQHRRGDPTLNLNVIACTALAALLEQAEAELAAGRAAEG